MAFGKQYMEQDACQIFKKSNKKMFDQQKMHFVTVNFRVQMFQNSGKYSIFFDKSSSQMFQYSGKYSIFFDKSSSHIF